MRRIKILTSLAAVAFLQVASPAATKAEVKVLDMGDYTISLEAPTKFLTQANLTDLVLANHDYTYPMIRLSANEYWLYLSEGGPYDGKHANINRIKTDLNRTFKPSLQRVEFTGIPAANVNEFNGWKAWLGNIYKINDNEYLGITHLEDQDIGYKEEFRLAMNYSKDGGKSFQHLGFILAPEIAPAVLKKDIGTDSPWHNWGISNISGGSIRCDDTYMYLYFCDVSRPDRSDRHGAVARAKLSTIIANARAGKNTEFFKYYDGKWEEPGMFGRSADLGNVGNHTNLVYNTYLKKWMHFNTMEPDGGTEAEVLRMFLSADPLDFNQRGKVVYKFPRGSLAHYFTVVPLPSENESLETCGKEFYIYFRHIPKGVHQHDTFRMKVTLNKK